MFSTAVRNVMTFLFLRTSCETSVYCCATVTYFSRAWQIIAMEESFAENHKRQRDAKSSCSDNANTVL